MSEDLGMKTVLLMANCSGTAPPSTRYLFVCVVKKVGAQIPAHLKTPYGMPSGPGAQSLFRTKSSSNSVLSMVQLISAGAFEHTAKLLQYWPCLGASAQAWKMVPQYSQSLLPDSSSSSKGWPSSSVTAWRQSIVFLARQPRCPDLHLASALSFSACVQGRFAISSSLMQDADEIV